MRLSEGYLWASAQGLLSTFRHDPSKTELAVVSFIAWATGLYLTANGSTPVTLKRLATNNAYGVREVMRHEVYQQIFPWVKIRDDSAAKDEFRTERGGVVYATSSEGSITGRGAGGMSGRFRVPS